MYGLRWSCLDSPASMQDITVGDIAIHGRGSGHASVELHVVVSANV